jgi:hypothetical protein
LVTDPSGHETGKSQLGYTVTQIRGSSYTTINGISAVVFPDPSDGTYNGHVIGTSVGPFVIASAVTDLVGSFLNSSATATIESVLHDAIQQQVQVKDYNLNLANGQSKWTVITTLNS